jgi:tRNA1(Val) A37 N6-methylase TrmN6
VTEPQAATDTTPFETIDAFHRGRFFLVQPKGRGHRAGMDAMLLAAMIGEDRSQRVADLGAGAGGAGLAVASRLAQSHVTLVERSSEMLAYAEKTLALPQNAHMKDRINLIAADVTLTGKARHAAGLIDNSFDHVIMNPPFNDGRDRTTPDSLKAQAHAMSLDLFEGWLRTAGAIVRPGGQVSLIARPQSVADIIAACGKRFGGIEVTLIHPREGESAIRLLLTAIKGSKARLAFRSPLIMHGADSHAFLPQVDDLSNGRIGYLRLDHKVT